MYEEYPVTKSKQTIRPDIISRPAKQKKNIYLFGW